MICPEIRCAADTEDTMDHFKYHPLIDCDDSGTEKVPLFFSLDRDVVSDQHSQYLEEIIPRRYRLISRDAQSQALATGYKIHCPSCGTVMDRISNPIDQHKLSLYSCPKCRAASNS